MPPYGATSAKPAAGGKGMSEDDFKSVAEELISAARDYMDAEVLPETERSWRYFDGEVDAAPMGFIGEDEQGTKVYEGSKVVVTECRDTLYSMLPELYRIFTASDEAVAFEPAMPEDVQGAEQATWYANWVWTENQGETLLNTALLDWGVKFAALKIWWEEIPERKTHHFTGLEQAAVKLLAEDEEVVEIEADPQVVQLWPQQQTPDGMMQEPMPAVLFSGKLVRETKRGKICIKLIPHEELLLDGSAQEMGEALIVGQDAMRTVDEVVGLGLDRDLVQGYAETGGISSMDDTTTTARTRESRLTSHGAVTDPTLQWVRVIEAQVRVDKDGDGQTEAYRVIALGTEPKVVDWQEASDCHYIVGSPFETAHRVIGRGVVETMTDLQDIGTSLFRRTLDNLNRSINPRAMVADSDQQTWDDLNSWFGGPIRVSRPDAVDWFVVPFTAQHAFPLMEYVQARAAMRTGISPAGMGLDPNVLKGQTLEGVHAMVTAPQSRIEYLARRFALSVMKPVFRAVLALAVQYQDKPSVIRQRNKWITVDPRSWNSSMDAAPRVGLGTGTRGEKILGYQMVLAKQEQLLAAGSPLVTLEEYKNTLIKLVECIGERDAGQFFKDLEPDELAAAQQQAQQAAQAQLQQQMMMQIELEKAKAGVKADVDVKKAQLTAQTDQQDAMLDARIAELKATQAAQIERLEHALAQQRLDYDHQLKVLRLGMENRLEEKKIRAQSKGGQGNLRDNA